MEELTKTVSEKPAHSPFVFNTYEIVKKVIKYSFYIALIYFAYEGFMAWK